MCGLVQPECKHCILYAIHTSSAAGCPQTTRDLTDRGSAVGTCYTSTLRRLIRQGRGCSALNLTQQEYSELKRYFLKLLPTEES